MLHYRTFEDLARLLRSSVSKLPWPPDLLAGVDRSGMLAAAVWSVHFNVPCVPVRHIWECRWTYGGARYGVASDSRDEFLSSPKKIVIVEDSVLSGGSLARSLRDLRSKMLVPHELFVVVVYGRQKSLSVADLVLEVCETPRMFEWNWRDNARSKQMLLDLDGVLCPDPPCPEERRDRYVEHISSAPPLYVPRRPFLGVATSRLEQYRPQTEAWLRHFQIPNRHLFMAPFKTASERRCYGNFKVKADIYAKMPEASIFVESSAKQGAAIHQATRKRVLVVETGQLLQ